MRLTGRDFQKISSRPFSRTELIFDLFQLVLNTLQVVVNLPIDVFFQKLFLAGLVAGVLTDFQVLFPEVFAKDRVLAGGRSRLRRRRRFLAENYKSSKVKMKAASNNR